MKKEDIRWVILIVLSAIYGVTSMSIIGYFMFAEFAIFFIFIIPKKHNKKMYYIDLLLVSAVIPDNYIIIAISLIWVTFFEIKGLNNYKVGLIAAVLYVFNIFVNSVPLVNWLFYLIYTLPFFSLYIFLKNTLFDEDEKKHLIFSIKCIIISQAVSVILYGLTHIRTIKAMNDMDWVTGTLGTYQSSVLMFIMTCSVILLLNEYNQKHNRWVLGIAVIGVIIAISTTSVTYTLILIIAVLICLIYSSKMSPKKKIIIGFAIFMGIIGFVFVSPDWIIKELPKLLDGDYLIKRVSKLGVYRDTFVTIPKEYGFSRSILGCGVGQYSSRAALTCSGEYIESYSHAFPISISEYTQRFIMDYNFKDQGLAGNSMSNIVSIQGEFGYIGLCLLCVFLFGLLKNSRSFFPLLLAVFFVGTLLVDNSLEYAKYGLFFNLCYFGCKNKKVKSNQSCHNGMFMRAFNGYRRRLSNK